MTDVPVAEATPIEEWLLRQQDLSAAERFALRHDEFADHGVAWPSGRWSERMPATPPGPGQQYAFDVDMDSCTGCKACVTACHNLNGLDEGEDWRRVGSLHGTGTDTSGGIVTVTSACHHCVDPACMNGCPAKAYEKDPITGIVRHLDDACIGCSYCTLTCPYEVPVFNQSLGIVRKCDMCSDRLAEGEAPACVQGCPQGAITITLKSTDDLLEQHRGSGADRGATLVPTAPPSRLTVPSTSYRSRRTDRGEWLAADQSSIHPSHGHTPLAAMLVLTQLAVGMTVAAAWLGATAHSGSDTTNPLRMISLVTGLVALGASVLHLGRPLQAWRAILGLRRSWLSREILAFGTFAAAGVASAVLLLVDAPTSVLSLTEVTSVVGGLAGVACSVRLYAVTGRRWWRTRTTMLRFGGTLLAAGSVATAAVLALVDPAGTADQMWKLLLGGAVGVVLSIAAPLVPLIAPRGGEPRTELAASRRLLANQLRGRFQLRLGAAALALFLFCVAYLSADGMRSGSLVPGVVLVVATVIMTVGEYHERRLFFLASVAPRMPGSPR